MAERTAIEWTDHTWSPWEGCTKVSVGPRGACVNCYAEGMNRWLRKGANWGPGAPRREYSEAHWQKPLAWNAKAERDVVRRRVFPSVCDPFDNEVPPSWRQRLFELIDATPHLDWLLLTKRIGNAATMIGDALDDAMLAKSRWPWHNVWLGATVVTQEEADRDVPKLLAVPARVRFLSIEPMLGPITLPSRALGWKCCVSGDHVRGPMACGDCDPCIGAVGEPMLGWVICGGESGHGARPMHPDWARSLRDQCAAAGVPFLFKQWGEFFPDPDDDRGVRPIGITRAGELLTNNAAFNAHAGDAELMFRVGKNRAGRLLDGIEHNGAPA